MAIREQLPVGGILRSPKIRVTTMGYKQLSEGQRYQIDALLRVGLSLSQIAQRIGCHKSSVCREIKRNKSLEGYCPKVAQECTAYRHLTKAKRSICESTEFFVAYGLAQKWSPEQISGVGKLIGYLVSPEWIYQAVREDKKAGGKLYKQLRHGHRKYRKGKVGKRVIIPNRIGIEHRPEVVDAKERFGDWEVDTVLGKQGTGAIVSLVERETKQYLIRKVSGKNAQDVSKAMIDMLRPFGRHVLTITADNGTEFCEHETVAKALKVDVYFADPYASWQRGLNENFNGLLRQYIPKGTDLRKVSNDEIAAIERQLNLRPRKCLGFRQPAVLFQEKLAV